MKVIIAIIQSCFSIFQAFIIGFIFNNHITANIIIAAKVDCGKWYNNGVKNNKNIATTIQATIEENHVLAHALKFIALLDNAQPTTNHVDILEPIFAIHCHINSWFADTDFFELDAIDLDILIVSANRIAKIVSAVGINIFIFSKLIHEEKGKEKGGNQAGTGHITKLFHNSFSYHIKLEIIVNNVTTINIQGNFGKNFLSNIRQIKLDIHIIKAIKFISVYAAWNTFIISI